MNKIIISCSVLGVVCLILSFITIRPKNKYKVSKIKRISSRLSDSKFINYFVNNKLKNKKLKKKIDFITMCDNSVIMENNKTKKNNEEKLKSTQKTLGKFYISKIIIFILILSSIIAIKTTFNKTLVMQELNVETMYNTLQYRVDRKDIENLNNYLEDKYIYYFKTEQYIEFYNLLKEYSDLNLNIDDEDLKLIANIYRDAYITSYISITTYLKYIIIAIISTFISNIFLNIKYKIYNIKLLDEFHNLELISLMHMTRDGINVYEILSELNKYSILLKPYLTMCLNKYPTNPIKALSDLAGQVEHESFKKFIGIFKSCLENPKDINYEVLKMQRKLRLLNDNIDFEKKIEFKQLYLTMAQLPLILMFTINLIMPMISQIDFSVFSM